jgi:hypothetical protein
MKYKQIILKKMFEINNFLNAQDALISTGRSAEEIKHQIERVRDKIREIEVLLNSEQESF